MTTVSAYGARSPKDDLSEMSIERRSPDADDVDIEILYCGVCHSDLHAARNDWGGSTYPVIPGHEIVGRVIQVGANVTSHKPGDAVAVGCLVDSCRQCDECDEGLEQYCNNGLVGTYGSLDHRHDNARTYGGYSQRIVVNQNFVLRLPETLDVRAASPLLCAGITAWSPLRHWQISAKDTVGIVGLGGIGHMGVKLARALGAKVIMITTSPSKAQDARQLGADDVLISTDLEEMKASANRFDFILNTIPVDHDINPYISLLKRDGAMVMVGAFLPLSNKLIPGPLAMRRRTLAGSIIGGIKETQELLDFCAEHTILPDIEVITMQEINTAFDRMIRSDVKYRFVIDMQSL